MTVNSATLVSDSILFLRTLLRTNVTDPISSTRPSDSKFVVTAFPERVVYFPLITIKAIGGGTTSKYVGTQTQKVNVTAEIRVWARNEKEKNTIADDVYDALRTFQTASTGTVDYEMYNFTFTLVGDVDENDKGAPKSRILQASYQVIAG